MNKGSEQAALKRRDTEAQKCIWKKYSISLFKKMQIRTIMTHNFTPIRIANMKGKWWTWQGHGEARALVYS
jgi:hypothetical protein